MFALFLCWRDRARAISSHDLDFVTETLRGVEGVTQALGFAPIEISGDQPFAADGRGPAFTLELRFAGAPACEAATAADGPLAAVVHQEALESLAGTPVEAQAFLARDFATPDPAFRPAQAQRPCTFLVEYPVSAADPAAWLDHYDAHHPPIMARFPAIRQVATYRPAPEIALGLNVARASSMQRNKVVFDSGCALAAALTSPVMAEMRADSAKFPPVSVRPTHFPMETFILLAER